MRWTVIEHAGKPVTSGPSALLAAPGGTIGRSPDNHLVLPDEQRQISRLQATVRFDEQGVEVLRNMSAVLPISVNGRTLQHEEESPVADGDRVTIGSYVLEAASGHRTAAVAPVAAVESMPSPPPAAPMRDVPAPSAMAQAPMDSLLPAAPVSDVFSDLFGAGALPIGDAQPVTVAMPPPTSPPPPPPRAEAPVAAPLPAMPAAAPAFASPLAPVPPPSPSPVSARTSASQIPSAADWDAILANAPRREKSAPEPMPDPMAHEPFELPSQARRNPVDPLSELNPHAATDMSDVALKRGVDPLSFFAADSNAPSPLSDPRPTALTHEDPLREVHPALDLLARPAAAPQGHSHSNHAREVSAQFRPPNPVAFDPPPAAKPKKAEVAAVPVEAPPPPPPPPPAHRRTSTSTSTSTSSIGIETCRTA